MAPPSLPCVRIACIPDLQEARGCHLEEQLLLCWTSAAAAPTGLHGCQHSAFALDSHNVALLAAFALIYVCMTQQHAAPAPADDLQQGIAILRSCIDEINRCQLSINIIVTFPCIYEELPRLLSPSADADVDGIV
jgi:hypothetical protein